MGARGHFWFPRSELVVAGGAPAVELSLLSAGLRLCGLRWVSPWAVSACVGPEVGDMTGNGDNVEHERERHARWSGVFAGFELAYRGVGRLRPWGGFEVGWLLERPAFGIRRDGAGDEVFRPSSVGVQGSLGLEFAL